jgi:hypothetical protein
MTTEMLSYAQSLRAIGQALEVLRITAFKLEKSGEKYIVSNWEPSFLDNIAENVWGGGDRDQMRVIRGGRTAPLVYTGSDTDRLEAQGRLRRGSHDMRDAHNISLALRAAGHYLDKNRAVAFEILWSTREVIIQYKTGAHNHKKESFTIQDLYDLGTGMYMRRSSRKRVK